MTTYRLIRPAGPLGGGWPFQKYEGEHHFPGYNYLGPGTRLDIRLDDSSKPKKGEEPINNLDTTALKHDITYKQIQDEYKRDKNKQKALNKIHRADEEFIEEAKHSNVQPLGNVSANIIKAKELGEKTGVLNTSTFSGLGAAKVNFKTKSGKTISFTKKPKKHDPTERLKKLAGIEKPKKKRRQKGGLAPLAIGVLSAMAGTALGKLWDLVKE